MTNIKPRMKIETRLDYDIKVFHVTSEISHSSIQSFYKPLPNYQSDDLKEVGGIGQLLVQELFTIIGINEIFIRPYDVMVIKGAAFNWEDIEPEVITALKRTFGPEGEKVEIVYYEEIRERNPENQEGECLLDYIDES